MSEKIQIIPEINMAFNKQSKLNNTLSVRYKLSQKKLADFYLSNAI